MEVPAVDSWFRRSEEAATRVSRWDEKAVCGSASQRSTAVPTGHCCTRLKPVVSYAISEILRPWRRKSRLEYLVDWEGYGAEEQSWVSARDMLDPLLFQDFHARHPEQPAPCQRGQLPEVALWQTTPTNPNYVFQDSPDMAFDPFACLPRLRVSLPIYTCLLPIYHCLSDLENFALRIAYLCLSSIKKQSLHLHLFKPFVTLANHVHLWAHVCGRGQCQCLV